MDPGAAVETIQPGCRPHPECASGVAPHCAHVVAGQAAIGGVGGPGLAVIDTGTVLSADPQFPGIVTVDGVDLVAHQAIIRRERGPRRFRVRTILWTDKTSYPSLSANPKGSLSITPQSQHAIAGQSLGSCEGGPGITVVAVQPRFGAKPVGALAIAPYSPDLLPRRALGGCIGLPTPAVVAGGAVIGASPSFVGTTPPDGEDTIARQSIRGGERLPSIAPVAQQPLTVCPEPQIGRLSTPGGGDVGTLRLFKAVPAGGAEPGDSLVGSEPH